MENLTIKNIYVIVDKHFTSHLDALSEEVYISHEEAVAATETKNLEYFLSIEGNPNQTEDANKSRYTVMDLYNAIIYINDYPDAK